MVDNQKPDPQDKKPDPVVPSEPVKPPSNGDTEKSAGGNEPADQPKKPVWEKRLRGWLVVVFTGVLAVYTAYLYTVAVTQTGIVKTYSDAAEVSAQAALRGVAVAESSIAVSKSIAENQKQFAKIETRAYVVFEDAFLCDTPKVGTLGPHDYLRYKNVGKTPAYKVKAACIYDVDHSYLMNRFKEFDEPFKYMASRTLGAEESSDVKWDFQFRQFTKEDSIGIFVSHKVMIWNFKVAYIDVFGDKHFVECIAYMNFTLKPVIIETHSN